MEEDHIERNKAGCKAEYRGDDDGFTVRFHRHCGEGWGTGVSANVPHGGTHDEEKIRESYESSILAMVKSNNRGPLKPEFIYHSRL